jgi:putative membrane protein insertion efficiency factor
MAGLDAYITSAMRQIKFYARNLAHSFVGFLVVSTLCCVSAHGLSIEVGGMKAPRSSLIQPSADRAVKDQSTGLESFLLGSVRFFQTQISPIDGARCSFSPTCSQFGYGAVHDHGPVLGVVLTADRLMRCSYWTEAGPDYVRLPDGALHDPVANNLMK